MRRVGIAKSAESSLQSKRHWCGMRRRAKARSSCWSSRAWTCWPHDRCDEELAEELAERSSLLWTLEEELCCSGHETGVMRAEEVFCSSSAALVGSNSCLNPTLILTRPFCRGMRGALDTSAGHGGKATDSHWAACWGSVPGNTHAFVQLTKNIAKDSWTKPQDAYRHEAAQSEASYGVLMLVALMGLKTGRYKGIGISRDGSFVEHSFSRTARTGQVLQMANLDVYKRKQIQSA
eukprot:1158166-Pelagomonas_calceolata.AAC.15